MTPTQSQPVEDPERVAAFEARVAAGESIEPKDWMPERYRRQLVRMMSQHAHSEIVGMLPEGKRNLAFGLFCRGYGFGWLIDSVTTGLLYEQSLPLLIGFSIAVQLTSLPLFLVAHRRERGAEGST